MGDLCHPLQKMEEDTFLSQSLGHEANLNQVDPSLSNFESRVISGPGTGVTEAVTGC